MNKDKDVWIKSNSFSFGDDGFAERIARNDFSLDDKDVQRAIDVCKTKNYFYVLYHGAPLGANSDSTQKYILQFSAKGDLENIYTTYKKIYTFCVKEDDSVLFAVVRDNEGEFILSKAQM